MKIKDLLVNSYVISIIAICAILFAVIFGVMCWLDSYTNHGMSIIVPDVTRLNVADAEKILKDKGLKCEVYDSSYIVGKKASEVLEQMPVAGAKVKTERTIYVSINSSTSPKVTMPDLIDNSVRQAEATLKSIGFTVSDYEYVPSEYKDILIAIKHNNKEVKAGEKINQGSNLTLVVGRGESNEEVQVVSLRGLTIEQARSQAHNASLNIGNIHYDVEPSSSLEIALYFVKRQSPITGRSVRLGQPIDIYVTKDKTQLGEPEEVYVDSSAINKEEDLFE